MLAAFALLLSYAETFVPLPIPVPGAKLGLANAAVLMALYLVGLQGAFLVALVKTLVAGLLFVSPLMLPYSVVGTLLAFLAMAALTRVPGLSPLFPSMLGALAHCAGQLAVASVMLGTTAVWFSLPVLALVALATGALTGKLVSYLMKAVEAKPPAAGCPASLPAGELAFGTRPRRSMLRRLSAGWLAVLLGAYTVTVLLAASPQQLGACALAAVAIAVAGRLHPKTALRSLAPLASVLVITAIAQIAYLTEGPVAFAIGPVTVTEHALQTTLAMFVRLLCLMMASAAVMGATDAQELAASFKARLARTKRPGGTAEALAISLDAAIKFAPTLVSLFDKLRTERRSSNSSFGTGPLPKRLREYASLLSPLAACALAMADQEAERFRRATPQAPVGDAAPAAAHPAESEVLLQAAPEA